MSSKAAQKRLAALSKGPRILGNNAKFQRDLLFVNLRILSWRRRKIQHLNIYLLRPLSPKPATVDKHGDGIRIVCINLSPFQETILVYILPGLLINVVARYSNCKRAIEIFLFKASARFVLQEVSELVVRVRCHCIRRKLNCRLVQFAAEVSARSIFDGISDCLRRDMDCRLRDWNNWCLCLRSRCQWCMVVVMTRVDVMVMMRCRRTCSLERFVLPMCVPMNVVVMRMVMLMQMVVMANFRSLASSSTRT